MPLFVEVEGGAGSPKCFLPGTMFLQEGTRLVRVEDVRAGDVLQGPYGTAFVEHVSIVRDVSSSAVSMSVRTSGSAALLDISVTADHRMCLQRRVHRQAKDLQQGDRLCTSSGDGVIIGKETHQYTRPVFAVTLRSDRSVFITMQSGGDIPMAVALGTTHPMQTGYVEFKFKGAVCRNWNQAESAEAWLSQFHLGLADFDLRFMDTSPYSAWVRQEQADRFFEIVKSLLPDSRSRLRRCSAPWQILPRATAEELVNAMPTEYED
eukprot:gb/GFBE01045610.1/.p1 GENE.gb/GFBE01045610.1/~~gb/GFBE01045610.1/.p1  ORF type:complete len:264 (+),score=45.17 gb/GFBE01045610.1/:1-792(+)